MSKCDHGGAGWPSFEALGSPLEGTFKCSHCGALAYRKKRPGHRGARPGPLRLYKCRMKDCENAVTMRKVCGWQLVNGCIEHPIERNLRP